MQSSRGRKFPKTGIRVLRKGGVFSYIQTNQSHENPQHQW